MLHFETKKIREQQLSRQMPTSSNNVTSDNASDNDTTTDKDGSDDEFNISQYHKSIISPSVPSSKAQKLEKRCVIDDPLFLTSLDRTKTKPSEAMHIVAPALQAVGIDVDNITLSTYSILARKSGRISIVKTIKDNFNPETP